MLRYGFSGGIKKGAKPAAKAQSVNARRQAAYGIAFVLPSLVGCAVFVLIPFASAVGRSFSDGFTGGFVWFKNYAEIFGNQAFKLAVGNTLRFMGMCVPLLLVLSLLLANTLDKKVLGRSFLRASFLMPMAVPVASVALLWQVVFHENGLIGNALAALGIDRIDFMKTDWAMMCLIVSYIWKNIGYNMVLFLAGLSNISPSLYEAAAVDGASPARQFLSVTLPCLKPTFLTVTVLSLLNSFKAYREVYLVAGNYPHGSIYLLQHTLNNWFTALEIERLSAAATVTALVILALVALLNRAWRVNPEDL